MRVIGTAGHVDHGKSTLVEALTGMDPDRLKEEKDRQMTIDLGFAWMTLPSGEGLGIVDVPGHRDFIENMLAGVGGIDAALLVVAVDEGVMPQTREHLAILELLEIERLLVALTKSDLQDDASWISLVSEEIAGLLGASRFVDSPIHVVSARTGTGIRDLIEAMDLLLSEVAQRPDQDRPRLPIDRAFSISGFGTVVTGTLTDGRLQVGEDVELLPQGLNARIRGLQTHKETVEVATPGSRVAANLSGIRVGSIKRGDVILRPGDDHSTTMVDAQLRVLPDAPTAIKHDMTAKFFSGAAQRNVRLRVLGTDAIKAGQRGWVQIMLEDPIVVRRGDQFILRRPSPSATLGGGRIANPHPARRHRRRDTDMLEILQQRLTGTNEQIFLASLSDRGATAIPEIASVMGVDMQEAAAIAKQLADNGEARILDASLPQDDWMVISARALERLGQQAVQLVESYHSQHPQRFGVPRQELRSKLDLATAEVLNALVADGFIQLSRGRVHMPGWEVKLSTADRERIDGLMARFEANPFSPPTVKQSVNEIGEELFAGLVEVGSLVRVSEVVVFTEDAYQQLVSGVKTTIRENGSITVAELRNAFSTTRKYALALLEQLDAAGVTYRDGDIRKLVRS
jgi:selenocysteine-specific elongation factor